MARRTETHSVTGFLLPAYKRREGRGENEKGVGEEVGRKHFAPLNSEHVNACGYKYYNNTSTTNILKNGACTSSVFRA